jgi:beta-glucosidase
LNEKKVTLVECIGRITALEMCATGTYWNFEPVIAVPQDIRWCRTYEGYSENTSLVSELAKAYIHGLPHEDSKGLSAPVTVLVIPKHFVGDGGTVWGVSIPHAPGASMLD